MIVKKLLYKGRIVFLVKETDETWKTFEEERQSVHFYILLKIRFNKDNEIKNTCIISIKVFFCF